MAVWARARRPPRGRTRDAFRPRLCPRPCPAVCSGTRSGKRGTHECTDASRAMKDFIVIRNARQNNLKGIDVELPRRSLVVLTGPSGSGKSSLAFDTLYAEGQRRYAESLSTYAKQFLGRLDRPAVD